MPLYAIAYVILNSTDNLRFDKEDYFSFLDGLFYERNRKHFSRVPIRYRNTRGSLEDLEIAWETLALQARVPNSISHSPKLPLVFL